MEKQIEIDELKNSINSYGKPKKAHLSLREWWRQGRHRLYGAAALLILLLLICLIWNKQMLSMWSNLFDSATPAAATSRKTSLETKNGIAPIGTTSGSDSSGSTSNSSSQKTSASGSTNRQSTSSTTTTTTTTTSTPPPSTPTGGGNSNPTPDQSTNLLNLYSDAVPGLTKSQLTNLANGQGPTSCTDISLTSLIQQSVCTWTSDGKTVVVTLQNGVLVGTPIKLGF